ncbi:MAG: DUF975 family protein [Clostridiales bacterium]|nr:DUF975 family protein [Clostridiales bacterium]
MNVFQSSGELKASAKEHMRGHYGTAIGAGLIVTCITGSLTLFCAFLTDPATVTGTVIYYALAFIVSLFTGLLTSGSCCLYLKISCGYYASIGDLLYGFKTCPGKALLIQLWITLISYLADLPLIIIGYRISSFTDLTVTGDSANLLLFYSLALILSYVVSIMLSLIYQQAFYLLHDFPQYSARELLAMSRRLMKGQKARLFYLHVSFLPLMLLGFFTFGIAFLWILPYWNAAQTEFFLDVVRHSEPHKMYG